MINETPGAPNNDFNRYFINSVRNGTYDYSNLSNPTNCGSSTTLDPCLSILPIDLEYFKGENKEYYNELSWFINNIEDVKEIQVERSVDGISFESISTLGRHQIDFNDYNPFKQNYYRLKITELTDEVTYSDIIYIECDIKDDIIIFPNPNNGSFTIKSNGINNLTIYNNIGQFISEFKNVGNNVELDLEEGFYYFRVNNNFTKVRIIK